MTIVEFLTARLDEDRELIRQLIEAEVPGRWTERRGEVFGQMTMTLRRIAEIDSVNLGPAGEQLAAEHIARFHPSRMLDEIDAKRAIIDYHGGYHECSGPDDNCMWILDTEACPTLKALASVYADRPDYQQEWVSPQASTPRG